MTRANTDCKTNKGKTALFLGVLKLILFAGTPYILDLIAPSKSMGQIISENAKDILNGVNGKENVDTKISHRDLYVILLTIVSFLLFISTFACATISFRKEYKKLLGIVGLILGCVGLGIYFFPVFVGFTTFLVAGLFATLVSVALANA